MIQIGRRVDSACNVVLADVLLSLLTTLIECVQMYVST